MSSQWKDGRRSKEKRSPTTSPEHHPKARRPKPPAPSSHSTELPELPHTHLRHIHIVAHTAITHNSPTIPLTDTTSTADTTSKALKRIITYSPASPTPSITINIIPIAAHVTQIAHVTLTLRNLTTQITHIIARSRLGSGLHARGV